MLELGGWTHATKPWLFDGEARLIQIVSAPEAIPDLEVRIVTASPYPPDNLVGGENVTDAYASLMASVGIKVQTARTAADISAAAADAAQAQVDAESGVNLDEEAARLLQYQQSYQAAAKVLQIAGQIFDTLLDVAAR